MKVFITSGLILIIITICIYMILKKFKKVDDVLNKKVTNYVLNKITPELFADELNNLTFIELFYEICKDKIKTITKEEYNTISTDFQINGDDKDYELFFKSLEKVLDSDIIKRKLDNLVAIQFEKNIKDALIIEQEAIEYHKQFGEELEGDPELHHVEEQEIEDIIQEKSIVDLESTGTIEDINE